MRLQHGTGHAYNQGWRCGGWGPRNPAPARARRVRMRALLRFVDDHWVNPYAPDHGTLNTYGNWQCRCAPCTQVHSDHMKLLRRRRIARGLKR